MSVDVDYTGCSCQLFLFRYEHFFSPRKCWRKKFVRKCICVYIAEMITKCKHIQCSRFFRFKRVRYSTSLWDNYSYSKDFRWSIIIRKKTHSVLSKKYQLLNKEKTYLASKDKNHLSLIAVSYLSEFEKSWSFETRQLR